MVDVIALFDTVWDLIWFPLTYLSLDYPFMAYPFFTLLVGMLFGSTLKLLRGVRTW
ncbi:MAG: hypothetical protein HFG54_15070 [Lachnospiraceae bacterium]|nr:hypothetical protein [Lachnospiraceae bacterium]